MMSKMKSLFLKYWLRFQYNWARAGEIHEQVEAQKVEVLMKYGNGFHRHF